MGRLHDVSVGSNSTASTVHHRAGLGYSAQSEQRPDGKSNSKLSNHTSRRVLMFSDLTVCGKPADAA